MTRSMRVAALAAAVCLAAPACSTMSEGEKRTMGTVIGAVGGALAGRAVAGKRHKTAGTLIGAVVGGVAGYVLAGQFGTNATPEQRASPEFQQAEAEFQRAEQARQSGDAQTAIQHYDAASRSAPEQPEPYNNAGLLYLQEGDRANAETMFRKALAADPEFEPAKQNLRNMGLAA